MESNNASFSLITHFNINRYKFYVRTMTAERTFMKGSSTFDLQKMFLLNLPPHSLRWNISKQGKKGSSFSLDRNAALGAAWNLLEAK